MNLVRVFGMNLRKYRRGLGVSQEQFAEMCGLHRTYISDLERFQRSIALDNIKKIANALKIEPYKLLIAKDTSAHKNFASEDKSK